jgi:small redox-active disulfide protein 2
MSSDRLRTVTLEVLGAGCPRCAALAANAEAAARQLGIPYDLVRVTRIDEIIDYGVMMTPALAVDGDVKTVGLVPSIEEIVRLLSPPEKTAS